MAILNYTTQIPVENSIAEIQKQLSSHGASAVLYDYDDQGCITAISFQITLEDKKIGFRLPSDWRPILKILEDGYFGRGKTKIPRRFANKEQALRVSWRIIKDWIEAQMAIFETKMVKFDQVFLPYAITPTGKTLYEYVQSHNLLAAPTSSKP